MKQSSSLFPLRSAALLIRQALREDRAQADITSRVVVPAGRRATATLIAKNDGVICGGGMFAAVFSAVDPRCAVRLRARDGGRVRKGTVVAEVAGPARAILSAERTALNFIQHLSGIATLTAAFTRAVAGTPAEIYDTRKTIPGMRELAKYAVRCGGGRNHRMSLSDMALIKDNHLALIDDLTAVVAAIKRARRGIRVEVECENSAQVAQALAAHADIIMLDNMSIPALRRSITQITAYARQRGAAAPAIEISGGVTLKTVASFARLGVTRISVGALTHSAPALDLSLEIDLSPS